MSALRELYGYLNEALSASTLLRVGDVKARINLAEDEVHSGGMFGMGFKLTKLRKKDPAPRILPPRVSSPVEEQPSEPREQSTELGVDLGVRPLAPSEESSLIVSRPIGAMLESRGSNNQHSSLLIEREEADLESVTFYGRVENGPRVIGYAWRTGSGVQFLTDFFDFVEPAREAIEGLLHHPYTESLWHLEPSHLRIVASTASMSVPTDHARVQIKRGITLFANVRAPAHLRPFITVRTDEHRMTLFGWMPLDEAAPIDMTTVPPFKFKKDDLELRRAYFRVWAGRKPNADGTWDDEDGGYHVAQAFMRGTAMLGQVRFPLYANVVGPDQILQIRDTGKKLPTAPLKDFDAVMAGSAWRDALLSQFHLPDDVLCDVRRYVRHIDLTNGVVSSIAMTLRVRAAIRLRTRRDEIFIVKPTFRWVVGFPYAADGPHVYVVGKASGRLVRLSQDLQRSLPLPLRRIDIDVRPSFHTTTTFELRTPDAAQQLAAVFDTEARARELLEEDRPVFVRLTSSAQRHSVDVWPVTDE